MKDGTLDDGWMDVLSLFRSPFLVTVPPLLYSVALPLARFLIFPEIPRIN